VNGIKTKKSTVKGFLNLSKKGGDQQDYILKLKKVCQKSMTTLCDIETTKIAVLKSLSII